MSQPNRLEPRCREGAAPSGRGGWTFALVLCVVLVAGLAPAVHGSVLPPASAAPPSALVQAATPTLSSSEALQVLLAQLDVAWNAQNWAEALALIAQITAIDPDYPGIQDRLYFAHVNYGYQLMTAGDCTGSLEQFRAALEVRPDGEEAVMGLELLGRYCATPVPATSTRTITIAPDVTATATAPPGTTATPTPQTLTEPITYTVQLGDTLYSLARRYNTTVQAIMQANGMMTTFLRAGSIIWIPASGAPPAGPIVHIVQPGETL